MTIQIHRTTLNNKRAIMDHYKPYKTFLNLINNPNTRRPSFQISDTRYQISVKVLWLRYQISVKVSWLRYQISVKVSWLRYRISVKVLWLKKFGWFKFKAAKTNKGKRRKNFGQRVYVDVQFRSRMKPCKY